MVSSDPPGLAETPGAAQPALVMPVATGIRPVDAVLAQFGRPTGWLGRLAGFSMVWGNRELNAWAVDLLDVRPTDRVLEVGYGPGQALEAIAARATTGRVAGVDHSAVMARQAASRNAAALWAGQVQLCQGSALALPYVDAAFDRALAVNVVHFWPDRARALAELRRVLRPDGLLVLVLHPRWVKEPGVRPLGEEIRAQVAAAGFEQVRLETRALSPVSALAVLARRPAETGPATTSE